MVDKEMLKQCRNSCNLEYPVQGIQVINKPDRDYKLGTSETNPGFSCVDILVNGGETRNGVIFYYLSYTGFKLNTLQYKYTATKLRMEGVGHSSFPIHICLMKIMILRVIKYLPILIGANLTLT
jgi:hypothetical protein